MSGAGGKLEFDGALLAGTADFCPKSANPSTASGPPTLKGQARTTPRFFNSHSGSFVVPDSPVTAVRVSWLPSLGELSAAILLAFNTKLQRLTEGFGHYPA